MPEYWHMFVATYTAIQIYIKYGDWYTDVVFTTGNISYRRFESLMAFWPAVLVLLGDLHDAGRNLNAFYKGVCAALLYYCVHVLLVVSCNVRSFRAKNSYSKERRLISYVPPALYGAVVVVS
jgi:hypothetical protein